MPTKESVVRKERDLADGARTILVVTRPDGGEVKYVVGRRAKRGALVGVFGGAQAKGLKKQKKKMRKTLAS